MTTRNDPKELTAERGKTHGDWFHQAELANRIKGIMRDGDKWSELPPFRKESLDMIATKISRILTGNHNEPDHWDDISGYAFLGKGGHRADE